MTHPLAGKRVAVVGTLDLYQVNVPNLVRRLGGTVVEASDARIDILFVGDGRGGKPPAEAAKVAKRLPSCDVVPKADAAAALLPTREMLLDELRSDRPYHVQWSRWDELRTLMHVSGRPFDLSGLDLRETRLSAAKLAGCVLDRANLSGVDASFADLSHADQPINAANFRGSNLDAATIRHAIACDFREATLTRAWLDGGKLEACDFRGANLTKARLAGATVIGCDFRGANLARLDADRCESFAGSTFAKATLALAELSKIVLDGCDLARADLSRADLRGASLKGCDLRKADLRGACCVGADFTGARLDGADFAGAAVRGATFSDTKKAKNLGDVSPRTPGPAITALADAAKGAKDFSTTAAAAVGTDEHVTLTLGVVVTPRGSHLSARAYNVIADEGVTDYIDAPDFATAMFNLADRWPGATPRLDAVTAKGSKTVRGAKLVELAVAAWAEAFGVAGSTEDRKAADADATERERQALFADLRTRGADAWNGLHYTERRRRTDFRAADLRDARLDGLELNEMEMDLRDVVFAGAKLANAKIHTRTLDRADFTRADLHGASLSYSRGAKMTFRGADLTAARLDNAHLHGADFREANLGGANLTDALLYGCDFTGANLSGATLDGAEYDETTTLPAGFSPPKAMRWRGKAKKVKSRKRGSLTYDALVEALRSLTADSRLDDAMELIRSRKLSILAETEAARAYGVVRSGSAKDRVYACMMTADGAYGCVSGKLAACGGQRGEACKHVLALLLGQVRDGRLDAAAVADWVERSRPLKPSPDVQLLSETLARHAETTP